MLIDVIVKTSNNFVCKRMTVSKHSRELVLCYVLNSVVYEGVTKGRIVSYVLVLVQGL